MTANDVLAAAFRKIGEGFYEAADVLFESSDPSGDFAARGAAPVASEPDFPPFEPVEYEPLPFTSEQVGTAALSRCPAHDRPWTVKAAGVSKMGKPYQAFWKCDGKDPDGTFCNRKPVKAWAERYAAAAQSGEGEG